MNLKLLIIVGIFLSLSYGGFSYAYANETYLISPVVSYSEVRFNNENWHTLPHPEVAQFSINPDGSAFGLTVTGISFIQYNVPNTLGIRVQRFEMQDHYHYIVEGTIAYSLTELSIAMAAAYEAKQEVG